MKVGNEDVLAEFFTPRKHENNVVLTHFLFQIPYFRSPLPCAYVEEHERRDAFSTPALHSVQIPDIIIFLNGFIQVPTKSNLYPAGTLIFSLLQVKFRFSEKATKIISLRFDITQN